MADPDQSSADYLAEALREMNARKASVAPMVNENRHAVAPDCPGCRGAGKKNGCGDCGVTK